MDLWFRAKEFPGMGKITMEITSPPVSISIFLKPPQDKKQGS
jgi:hypothetical protein